MGRAEEWPLVHSSENGFRVTWIPGCHARAWSHRVRGQLLKLCWILSPCVKQAGFFTGKKKESMFKSPDAVQGKVGVVGSGQSMTEFQRRGKHINLKTGEDDDDGAD